MDSDNEFPQPSYREREAIRDYLQIEYEFMPPLEFYANPFNVQYRRHAVSTMVRLSQGEDVDAYIPYLAMNYFDRFVSMNPLAELRGFSLHDKVRLVAICCFTLSAKMRTTHFLPRQFQMNREVNFNSEKIMQTEFCILNGLNWRMRSITPFHFLDHYYPTFRMIGGFKRRSINEIIVQSQGEVYFTQFKPSDIAMCALLAATYLGYSSKFSLIEKSISLSREHVACYLEMVHLCRKRSIEIRSASGAVIFSVIFAVPCPPGEAAGAQTQTTKSEEELGKAVESQVKKTSWSTKFWNSVLYNDDEEENVTPLSHRRRRDRGKEAAETGAREEKDEVTSEEFLEAESGPCDDRGEGPSEEIVEAESGARDDKCEGPSEEIIEAESGARDEKSEGPSKEIVEAESRAREDKRKVEEMCEVEEERENESQRRQITGNAVEETGEVEKESENESLRRQITGKTDEEIGEVEEESENVSRQRQTKGKAVEESCKIEEESENELRRRQIKGKAVEATCGVEKESENESQRRQIMGGAAVKIREIEEENENNLRLRQIKGKDVLDICKVEEESETESPPRQRIVVEEPRFMSDIGPDNGAAPLRQMNFQLRWPIILRPGEIIDYIDDGLQIDESRITSIRCPSTIRGTGNDPPLVPYHCFCSIM